MKIMCVCASRAQTMAAGVLLAPIAALVAIGCFTSDAVAGARLRVAVENGNVVLFTGNNRKTLTSQQRDSEAVISPDQQWVIYTRSAKPASKSPGEDDSGDCTALSAPDELRRVRIDGAGDELLIRGQAGSEPSQALCAFQNKQFSADGETLFFLSPAWATSSALHAFTLKSRTARYVMPANDFAILSWCTSDLKDSIVAQQHRYLRFGGSFDWYWLFDASGAKEIAPVGEFDSFEAVKADLDASGQCAS